MVIMMGLPFTSNRGSDESFPSLALMEYWRQNGCGELAIRRSSTFTTRGYGGLSGGGSTTETVADAAPSWAVVDGKPNSVGDPAAAPYCGGNVFNGPGMLVVEDVTFMLTLPRLEFWRDI